MIRLAPHEARLRERLVVIPHERQAAKGLATPAQRKAWVERHLRDQRHYRERLVREGVTPEAASWR